MEEGRSARRGNALAIGGRDAREAWLAAGVDYIQITSSVSLDASAMSMNGVPLVASLAPYLVTSPDLQYELGETLTSFGQMAPVSYYYQVPVTTSFLQAYAGADETSLNFTNLPDPYVISSFDFIGGDQEYVVVVPEPASFALLAVAGLMLLRRRSASA